MSYAESDDNKPNILNEAEFAALVRQHRAKVLTITGRLLRKEHQYVVAVDGGGQWFVDGPSRLYCHVGQRVTVEGTRFGFNGIDVTRFRLANADWPPDGLWQTLKGWFSARLWLVLGGYLIFAWWQRLPQIEPLSSIIFKHFLHL
jgi:hypothetical protein